MIAEEFSQRGRAALFEEILGKDCALTSDEIIIEGIARECRVEQLPLICEHAVLDGIC